MIIGVWVPGGKTHLIESLPTSHQSIVVCRLCLDRHQLAGSYRSVITINGREAQYGGLTDYPNDPGWLWINGSEHVDFPPVCEHCLRRHRRRVNWAVLALQQLERSRVP